MIERVEWCQICNSRPADGDLTVIPDGETQEEVWKACEICVAKLPKEAWE